MMKFFSKQNIAIFFSLSFFMISAEAWAVQGDINVATTGTCQNGCDGVNVACTGTETFNLIYGTRSYPITCTGAGSPNSFMAQKICGEIFCEIYNANISMNTFGKTMCNAFRIVSGSAGKTFAAFAIIATGIGFFFWKSFLGFDDWCGSWYCHNVRSAFNCCRNFRSNRKLKLQLER